MNTGVTKTDFIYFQNDILKDIKNLEKTFTEKIESIINEVNKNKTFTDSNFTKYSLLISDISEKVGASEGNSKIIEELNIMKKKLEDLSINSRIKINSLEKEFNNMSIKYDKIFITNLVVPGLIGSSCPFPSLASFIDNANKKINELIIDKKKKDMDLKSYKEKLESLINTFNTRVNTSEEKFKQYCNLCFENFDKNSNERFNILEERINTLRMENGKYSAELIERSNELKTDWDKIMNIKTEIYDKLNSELEKYVKYNSDLLKVFESQRSEFTLLKNRFTELSEFIKDVRFRNNITSKENNIYNSPNLNAKRNKNLNNNAFTELTNYQKRVKFTQMSKRINFKLKQNLNNSFNDIKNKKHLTNINRNYQEKKENGIHHSPSKTEYRFGDNDSNSSETFKNDNEEKNEEISLDNKDLENNKQNEEEKDNPINKEYSVNKPLDLDKERSKLKNYFNPSIKNLKSSNQINNANLLNKKKHKTSILGHTNLLSTKKLNSENQQNKSTINKDGETEFSGNNGIKPIINKKNKLKNLETNEEILKQDITKTTSIKKLKLNLNDSPKSRNDSPKEKINNRKTKFNKTIKVPEIKSKVRESNKLKTHIHKSNLKIKIEEKMHENNNINNNIKKEKNRSNIKLFTPISKKNSSIKKDSNNSDNENKQNKIKENKFSFVTNINTKEKEISKNEINNDSNKIDDDIDISEESINLNMNRLNEKIIKINNRLTELYKNSEIKINKIYLYVKKVFDHFSGIFFFKEIYNQKFNFDYTNKTLMTDFTSIFPAHINNKRKIILKGKDKNFTPKNIKKQLCYKTIVDQIEPFLIKKFKD